MRESFAFDREKLYGFDFDNSNAAWTWMQNEPAPVFEEPSSVDEVVVDEPIEAVEPIEEMIEEISAKEAFFEFARAIPVRPPQPTPTPLPWPPNQQHRPPQHHPHPPGVPHPHPQPPRPPHPHPGAGFNPHSGSAPRFAPPAYVPQMAPGLRAVDPGAISRCLYSNTYVWLRNRQEFWFFPTFVGRKSIAGYRWMHRNWVYMGFSLNMIDSFFCGGR